jgi:hypothetical protein
MKPINKVDDPRAKQFEEDGKIIPFLQSLKPEDNIYIRDFAIVSLPEEEHLTHPVRVQFGQLPPTMLDQDSCLDCVRKHVGRAIKKMEEVIDGNLQNSLRAQIELEEAEEEAKKMYPDLADAIRQVRKSLFV